MITDGEKLMRDSNYRECKRSNAEYLARAIKRAALVKISTLTQAHCWDLLALDPQGGLLYPSGIRALQVAVTQLLENGTVSARDIDRVIKEDSRT